MAAAVHESPKVYHYVSGFGSLADFIANDGDYSAATFKRFDRLAARDLLYYQSQLAEMNRQQEEYDIEDAADIEHPDKHDLCDEIRDYTQDWSVLEKAGPDHISLSSTPSLINERWKKRMNLAMEIRKTLKSYREALIQEQTLLSMQRPSRQTMTTMANYFHTRASLPNTTVPADEYPSTIAVLTGASASLYPLNMSQTELAVSDYISLAPAAATDRLTGFLKAYCSRLFRLRSSLGLPQYNQQVPTISHLAQSQVRHYSLHLVTIVASFITTILAATLLFLPIYILYHVSSTSPRMTLGLISMFTVLFALALFLTTNARRSEVFGACAAYAAVLVVFVSGDFARNASA